MHIGENISDMAHALRDRLQSMRHLNEKHVDDMPDVESEYSVDDPKAELAKQQQQLENQTGVNPVVKTFYEGKNSNATYYEWVDSPPRQLSKRVAKQHDRVAIKLYKAKDLDKPVLSGRFALKPHMMEIQNPILVAALKDIVAKEDVHLELSETVTFKEPFRALYFCHDEITALHRTTPEGSALKLQLQLLLKVMADIFANVRKPVRQLQASGLINFRLAWTYFPKDCIVYSPGKDAERIYKIVDTSYQLAPKPPRLLVKAKEIAFDGSAYVWQDVAFGIAPWEGNKPVTKLQYYPLEFHPDPESVKKRIGERGERVLDYQGLKYCMYTGLGIYEDDRVLEKHNVDGRILIDIYGYNKHHLSLHRKGGKDLDALLNRVNNCDTVVIGLPPAGEHTFRISDPNALGGDVTLGDATNQQAAKDDSESSSYIKRLTEADQEKNKCDMLARPADLLFLSPKLCGYALQNKLWLSFYVDDIRPMAWNEDAYSHLVYPEEQKDLVLSFVENHQRTRQPTGPMAVDDDVIKGKGRGLILLLSGPPGTGKTLTAEAVADKTRRPLYYLQAEDLGINAAVLGANIKKVFEMATEWDAVILLDEADVFMAERNPQDIARNELVSIFLRELEYFKGIIFLTTNLYNSIDSAFRSRVNIHLLFQTLPPKSRELLWRKFLERLPPMKKLVTAPDADALVGTENGERIDPEKAEEEVLVRPLDSLTDEDITELSLWELNGREIKNSIKTVKSWCDCKGYDMSLMRLESGIKVTAPQATKRGSGGDMSLYD